MKDKRSLLIYTMIWGVAVLILVVLFLENLGFAKVINYSGIVRGATQKLVKEELNNEPDDALIQYLDDILEGLQHGGGTYDLTLISARDYQYRLKQMRFAWNAMKEEIAEVRAGKNKDVLYEASQEYFVMADEMVATAESISNRRLVLAIGIFFAYVILSGGFFLLWFFNKQKQLDKVRYVDELTGLANLSGFELSLRTLTDTLNEGELALAYFDLDDFKYVNATYGYAVGDQILSSIGSILAAAYGKDRCARAGNDNFYVCVKLEKECLEKLRRKLRKQLKKTLALDVIDETTITVGACIMNKKDELHDMLDNAMLAHKRAKQSGKGSLVWYDQQLLNRMNQETLLIKQRHAALAQHEFKLYLQPKFEIPSLEVYGAEALVRWSRKDGTQLPPDDFIPLFEENGFIHELDFYMLKQVCRFVRERNLQDHFMISVNFSRVTIHHRDFYEKFHAIVDAYAIPARCLQIEITESAFNGLAKTVLDMLNQLKREGFILSIDDFGSGYSSLNLLNTLMMNEIKIDRVFLNEENERREQIIGLIVDIAATLEIDVICEGVETQADVDMLRRLHCGRGQGFYLSRPLPEQEFADQFLAAPVAAGE